MKYKDLKKNNPGSIIIQQQGMFYIVYDTDTYIINHLFNYKIKSSNNRLKVGFPDINKVIKELDRLQINYVVNDIIKIFENNNYLKYDIELITRINKIISKLKTNIPNEKKIKKIERIL